jgi:hypothetical protein
MMRVLNAKGFHVIEPEKVFSDPVVNPYFTDNFSTNLLRNYLTSLPEAKREWPYLARPEDQENVHQYLRAQGLEYLLKP